MRHIIMLTLLLAGTGLPVLAQSPYGSGGGGAGGRGRGGNGDQPRYAPTAEPLPSPEDLAGPALPEFAVDRFELDSVEAQAYRVVYDSFMTATRALRDTAVAVRGRIDAQWQLGDRTGARNLFPILRRLGDALSKEDGRFDDRLKKVFSKAHYKDYKDWRSDQRKQAEEDRKERMKGMEETPPSPGP